MLFVVLWKEIQEIIYSKRNLDLEIFYIVIMLIQKSCSIKKSLNTWTISSNNNSYIQLCKSFFIMLQLRFIHNVAICFLLFWMTRSNYISITLLHLNIDFEKVIQKVFAFLSSFWSYTDHILIFHCNKIILK